MKIQPLHALIAEMRAVARGKTAAPASAAEPSIESAEALLRTIHDAKPQSVATHSTSTSRSIVAPCSREASAKS
jgi:hypothetical protein